MHEGSLQEPCALQGPIACSMNHEAPCADCDPMQNRRGGRVKLLSILLPETEFNHKDKVTSLMS